MNISSLSLLIRVHDIHVQCKNAKASANGSLVCVGDRTRDRATLHNSIRAISCALSATKHFPTATAAITLPDYSIKQRGEDVCLPSLFWLTNAAVTQCHFRCELDSDPMVGRSVGRSVVARALNVDPGNVVRL